MGILNEKGLVQFLWSLFQYGLIGGLFGRERAKNHLLLLVKRLPQHQGQKTDASSSEVKERKKEEKVKMDLEAIANGDYNVLLVSQQDDKKQLKLDAGSV